MQPKEKKNLDQFWKHQSQKNIPRKKTHKSQNT